MFGKLMLGVAAAALVATPASARQKNHTAQGYALPADKPVTILLMRPDMEVGEMQAGGLIEPNADWTKAAREHLAKALQASHTARNIELKTLDPSADSEQLINDYEALHRAVADAIITYKYYGAKLPTKKDKFDWTLGPDARKLGEASGANYALFFYGRDNFASAGRKAVQVAGFLGCLIGVCVIAGGGQHVYYASLVELSTGNVVWFNIQRGSKGDVREEAGAQSMVDAVMASMPSRPGEGGVAPVAAARKR
ncbi:hypothetical protein [Sphingomonas sp.]|uniref:hypothetical protein n=1 Tax=Sphingomonas sp. TaxID=28214 RepID=UPI003BAAAB8E